MFPLKHLNRGRMEETEQVQSEFAEMRLILSLFSSVESSTRTAARPQHKSFEMIYFITNASSDESGVYFLLMPPRILYSML